MSLRGKNLEKHILEKYETDLKTLLENWYLVEEMTQKQIAEKLGVSTGAISSKFKQYEIPKREHNYWLKGFKHNEESLKKISEAHKGKKVSEETRKKMSEARKGHKLAGRYDTFKGIKNRKDGYKQIHKPEHPFSDSQGYVMEHRLVMESVIGRYLEPTEEVHHKNEIKSDNRPENLHLFKNKAAHMYFHMMMRYGNGVELKYEYK